MRYTKEDVAKIIEREQLTRRGGMAREVHDLQFYAVMNKKTKALVREHLISVCGPDASKAAQLDFACQYQHWIDAVAASPLTYIWDLLKQWVRGFLRRKQKFN